MRILALDTARGHGGVALWADGRVAAAVGLGESPGFGEVLFGAVGRLLRQGDLTLAEMDGFAAATGPGWFTGIRVGLVAAKAFAEVHGKPLAGVSTLRALACSAPPCARRVALLDARRGEVFAGFYDAAGVPFREEAVGRWQEFSAVAREDGTRVVVNEPSLLAPGGPLGEPPVREAFVGPLHLAAEVAAVAARDIGAGRGSRPEQVEANYIRRPSAKPPAWVQAASR